MLIELNLQHNQLHQSKLLLNVLPHSLQILNVSFNDIDSLDSFPYLPQLERLNVEGNAINTSSINFMKLQSKIPSLQHLQLNNKFVNLSSIQIAFPELLTLDGEIMGLKKQVIYLEIKTEVHLMFYLL